MAENASVEALLSSVMHAAGTGMADLISSLPAGL